MSWWDSSSFSSFATNALKTAQQRIDKVLDIKDEENVEGEGATPVEAPAVVASKTSTSPKAKKEEADPFWSSYFDSDSLTGFTSTPSKSKSVSKPTARTPTPSKGGSSQQSPSNTSERSELKTSATSAFTVRSKRVESTLAKYQLKAETAKPEPASGSSSPSVEKTPSSVSEPAKDKSDAKDKTSSSADVQTVGHTEENVSDTKAAEPQSGTGPSPVVDTGKPDGSKKKGPLRLGSKLSKKKEEEDRKKAEEEAAKKEKAAIAARVEELLEQEQRVSADTQNKGDDVAQTGSSNDPGSQSEVVESSAVNVDTGMGADNVVSTPGWSDALAPDMVQSAEGSGWEEEDLDIDDIADDKDDQTGGDGAAHKPEPIQPSEKEPEEEAIVPLKQEAEASAVVESESTEQPSQQEKPETEVSEMEESSQSVEVIEASDLLEDDTNNDEKPPEVETTLQSEQAAEATQEHSAADTEQTSEGDTYTEVPPSSLPQDVETPEVIDGLTTEVSFDSSDTTETEQGADDQLSESSRTLTGDDFHSPQEGEQQQVEQVTVDTKPVEESAATGSPPTSPESSPGSQDDSRKGTEEDKKSGGQLVSSSYVKTMLEEAMTESVKDTDSHSSTSDKSSEMVRIESGLNSGHTSGDEVDTTTSSDIEIISTPTPNGEYRQERPFDLSPLRHALSRTMRRGSPPGHKRSDSSSSAQSAWSKNGDDLLSPDGGIHREAEAGAEGKHDDHHKEHMHEDLHGKKLKEEDEEQGSNNPLETQTLLKHTEESYNEKLAEMAEILEAREKKLVELSRENIDLQESKAILKNQLQQSEEAREAELEDLNTVTEEFTGRISEFEQKLQQLSRERDAMKKQLAEAQNELTKRSSSSSSLERLLKEKDQQVAELLDEGEKLSKQQLQSNNIIKKLRAKEKDSDAIIKAHKQKLEQQTEELNHLRKVLDAKEDVEKKQIEAIGQQNTAVKRQEAELSQLRLESEDMQEKVRSLQVALDNSYKEISELHKANAVSASETATAKLSVEMTAKQELQMAMERQTMAHKQQMEALLAQIEDMQLSMVRQEREQGRREDVLRQEISDVQQRLQEAEERNQDLTQSVTSATRPLLRQIENLQSTYTAQSGSYEKVERNLTERLHEAQNSLAEAVEKERAASENLMEVTSRLTTLETQVSTLRQEKSNLQAHLEVEKTKVMVLEDAKNSEAAQMAIMKTNLTKDITELKKEKVMLENQWEMEKMRVEAEKKKLTLAHEQLRDKEFQLQRQGMTPSPRSTTTQDQDSISGDSISTPMTVSVTQEDILEKTLMLGSANGNKSNLYETLRHTGAATLMENLQSQLKMKEGEVAHLQNEIAELERTREAMARELVNLSTQNDTLKDQLEEYPELKKAHGELDSRYNALLQMYGEKVEEADELNMDLQDIKDMYKAQIEELVKRVR